MKEWLFKISIRYSVGTDPETKTFNETIKARTSFVGHLERKCDEDTYQS